MGADEIMTVEEVAKYLKMKPQTVYKWAQQGQIPGTKLGKEWRFRRGILDAWIDTSINLSQGGFDLLRKQGRLSLGEQGVDGARIDALIAELRRD